LGNRAPLNHKFVHPSRETLFPGGVGRTNSSTDFESLINDIQSRVFDYLPDGTWFYPGHGDDSTLGEQKPHINEWRSRGW
jgi:glyoxylase-like metal-dependent hydrolase (beta-lactamase superfamily II)